MAESSLLQRLATLATAGQRAEPARALARDLGAEELLLFVLDPEVQALLPAPGFPQTLPGGRAWRALLARVGMERVVRGQLPFPDPATVRPAWAFASHADAALVLLGGTPDPGRVQAVLEALPLLAATLRAERRAAAGDAQATAARHAAQQAETLAHSLAQAQLELQAVLRELREADRRKDQFLAMLAHELRNPLAPLHSALHLLRTRAGDPAAASRALEVAQRQAWQLTRLVDDLLDVSRITRGRIELKRECVDLTALAQQSVAAVQPLAEQRGHQVVPRLPSRPVWVSGDALRLEQVLLNLLNNAVKYTEPGGRVWVELEAARHEAVLRVRDTGIGLSPDLLPRIFDLFVQADQPLARSQGGLGIGLTLVRSLVELHGGRVSVHSEGLGRGAEFQVHLPLAEPLRPVAPPQEPAPAPPPPTARRVLVVDDNLDAAELLHEVLQDWGHEVRVAHDGLAAVDLASAFQPQVVVLDIGLPGIDGYEVAARLRQQEWGRSATLVALTGYGQPSDRQRALEAGFDLHWVKPVSLESLATLLETPPAQSARRSGT